MIGQFWRDVVSDIYDSISFSSLYKVVMFGAIVV